MPSKLVMLTWNDSDGAPPVISGGPSTPPVFPNQGLPVYPSNGLPISLPVFPFDPTKPVDPDAPPPPVASTGPIVPGRRFIAKWLACVGLILVPDNSLPEGAQPK